jgi:hypothetical protein
LDDDKKLLSANFILTLVLAGVLTSDVTSTHGQETGANRDMTGANRTEVELKTKNPYSKFILTDFKKYIELAQYEIS